MTCFASVHLWFFHLLLLDRQVVHRAGFLGHHKGILRRRGDKGILGRWWRWVQLLWLGRRWWGVVLLVVLRRWWRDAIRVPLRLHTRFFPFLILVLLLLPVHLAVPLPILPIRLPPAAVGTAPGTAGDIAAAATAGAWPVTWNAY